MPVDKILLRRVLEGLKSPWSVAFSMFGAAYGAYNLIDMSQSGAAYYLQENLEGKTYIVTGATSGIGRQTSLELAERNARVIMACRNREKCIRVRRDIVLRTKNKQVYCRQCDLEDFESVRKFIEKLYTGKFEIDRIDGIVHNAATMESTRSVNKDGIERTLATNLLGPFLMTALLLEKLLVQSNPSRIVFLNTNVIDRKCQLNFDDFNFEKKEKWNGYDVYKQTKLAQAVFAKELADRLENTNVTVTVADPGRARTDLSNKLSSNTFFLSRWLMKPVSFVMGERRVEKAVRPILYALADKEMEGNSGLFIDRERKTQQWCETVMNKKIREKVWLTSEKWTRLCEKMEDFHKTVGEPRKQPEQGKRESKLWKFWFW